MPQTMAFAMRFSLAYNIVGTFAEFAPLPTLFSYVSVCVCEGIFLYASVRVYLCTMHAI